MNKILAENRIGWKLLAYLPIKEEELEQDLYQPVTGAFAILKVKDCFVLGFNSWRNQWEFPAGGIEKGETAREAAVRELFEETHQRHDDLIFKGIFKICDQHDKIRYQAVFYGEQETLEPFVKAEGDEMDEIILWDMKAEIGYIDEVDWKIVQMSCLEPQE